MIGRIAGILIEKQAPELLVDVQGVGYEVQVSLNTFFGLPALGESVTLFTHFVVREDAQQLYGFAESRERELFRTLIKVNGVGPKMALAILSGMTTSEFVHSVQTNNAAMLVKLPGVGKKTAERLIVEMRDRLEHFFDDAPATEQTAQPSMLRSDSIDEAESALIALGYKPQEASRMVSAAAKGNGSGDDSGEGGGDGLSSQELIRLSLKSMVKN